MWQGIDLIEATSIVPFELNPPMKLGKLTLNRNPTNFFAEPESISFAPSNVVDGVSFVPDPLLQWRLMSYDDTGVSRPVRTFSSAADLGHQQPTDTILLTATSYPSTKRSFRSTIITVMATCSHCSSKAHPPQLLTTSAAYKSHQPTKRYSTLVHPDNLQALAISGDTSLPMTGHYRLALSGAPWTFMPSNTPSTPTDSSSDM